MDIDLFEVIDAARTKPFGFQAFYPGPGLGGHCIPIDPFYLSWKAREFDFHTRFIELAGEINSGMPYFVVDNIIEAMGRQGKVLRGARILILGLAYKRDIDDLRESPSLTIIELLQKRGAQVEYNDPFFPTVGRGRKYALNMTCTPLEKSRNSTVSSSLPIIRSTTTRTSWRKPNLWWIPATLRGTSRRPRSCIADGTEFCFSRKEGTRPAGRHFPGGTGVKPSWRFLYVLGNSRWQMIRWRGTGALGAAPEAENASRGKNSATQVPMLRKWIVKLRPRGNFFFKSLLPKGGSSSVVERQLPKLNVAGSIPVSRSRNRPLATPPF